jgi:gamma-glutamyltranspeptidase
MSPLCDNSGWQSSFPQRANRCVSHIGFGIMGGLNQAHTQFVSNIADHGMNIQSTLGAPRFNKIQLHVTGEFSDTMGRG